MTAGLVRSVPGVDVPFGEGNLVVQVHQRRNQAVETGASQWRKALVLRIGNDGEQSLHPPALALENYRLPSAFNPISTSRRTASERLGLLCHYPMAGCTVGA